MRLSKSQSQLHQQVLDLVHSDRRLTEEEKFFILDNYQESAGALNSLSGAFFTPQGLARDFALEVQDESTVIDLCAGIGRLGFAVEMKTRRLVCVEYCQAYVDVGRRILPDAEWIRGDVFDANLYDGIGGFDCAISNPPFGQIKTGSYEGVYTGGLFEYRVMEMASRLAEYGVFIIPQESAPFRYSGVQSFRAEESDRCRAFAEQTGIEMGPSCGIDTSVYAADWHGVSPKVEIVVCEFERARAAPREEGQLALFGEGVV